MADHTLSSVCWPPTQWGKTVISRTFGHKLGKKSDTDVVEGLLEAYYEVKHKKMTKYENWHPGQKYFCCYFSSKSTKIPIFSIKKHQNYFLWPVTMDIVETRKK